MYREDAEKYAKIIASIINENSEPYILCISSVNRIIPRYTWFEESDGNFIGTSIIRKNERDFQYRLVFRIEGEIVEIVSDNIPKHDIDQCVISINNETDGLLIILRRHQVSKDLIQKYFID